MKKWLLSLLFFAALALFLSQYGMRILVSFAPLYVQFKHLPPNITPTYYNYDGEKEGIFTHRFVHINETLKGNPTNVTFHIVTAGDPKNPAVAFFHGATDTWFMWSEQMKDLADEFYLLSFDMKGIGQTSKPYSNKIWPELNELGGDYSLIMSDEEYVTALDKLGVKQFHLVTWDLSSFVMHALPAVWSDRVLSYVKGQSTVAIHDVKHVPQFKFFQHAPRETWQFLEAIRDALVLSSYTWPEHAITNCRAYQKIDNKTIERILHEYSYPGGSIRGWVSYINALELPVVQIALASYAEYKCPVFIFQGARDPAQPPYYYDGTAELDVSGWGIWPVSAYFPWGVVAQIKKTNSGKPATAYFPKAPVAVYESVSDAGHFLPLEKPHYTSDSLRLFFKGKYDEVRKRHESQPKIELDDCALIFGMPDPNCRKNDLQAKTEL